jgi:hypothetical protein
VDTGKREVDNDSILGPTFAIKTFTIYDTPKMDRRSLQRFTDMTIGVLPFRADVDTSIHQVDYDPLLEWAGVM